MRDFIARKLSQDYPGQKWAFILYGREVYYTVFQDSEISYAMSPVICLLQQIFDSKQDHSFFILRKAIVTNYHPREGEWGMVKVVAKRVQQYLPAHGLSSQEVCKEQGKVFGIEGSLEINSLAWFRQVPGPLVSLSELHQQPHELFGLDPKSALRHLVQLIPRGSVLHDFDRPIAALLVDSKGQVLEFGVNSNHINKTLHAEVNLLQRYYEKYRCQLPVGSKIYVTHKPCKMCAGMIWQALPENFEKPVVTYFEDVPGSLSAQTILDSEGCAIKGIL
jgi:deoxycytidylate deaminase